MPDKELIMRSATTLGFLVLLAAGGLMPDKAWAIDGLTYATGLSQSSSDPTRTVNVWCPEEMLAIGGGAIVSGSNKVAITSAIPEGRNFKVAASEPPAGVSSTWYVVAIAICAPRSSLRGLTRREIFSRTNGDIVSTPACDAGQ